MQEYETKEITYGNAVLVINRPILNEADRKRRETNIQNTLRIVGKELTKKGAL